MLVTKKPYLETGRKHSLDTGKNNVDVARERKISLPQLPNRISKAKNDLEQQSAEQSSSTIGDYNRKLSLNLDPKVSHKADRKTSLPHTLIRRKEPSLGRIKEEEHEKSEVNLIDDLFNTDRVSVSSGYHSISQQEDALDEALPANEQENVFEDATNSKNDSSSDSESEDDTNLAEPEFDGECALDMFIDPLNPFGKAVHSTLQSKINDQKNQEENLKKKRAERRTEKLREMQLDRELKKKEKELDKLKRRLDGLMQGKRDQEIRTETLNGRMAAAKEREANYYRRYEVWKDKMEELYQGQLDITIPLEDECRELRSDLYGQQKLRMEAFKAKMDPIIIREAPSKSANYKMQAKYLQYEIYPLTQRFRLTQMRADSEEMKRRGVEKEVWQLRDKISDYNTKISVATKGVPISKTMLSKITDHKKKWKLLCNSVKIAKELTRRKSTA